MFKKDYIFSISNLGGAFADGAILFPLLMLLSQQIGFSTVTLLISAGCAYLWAGFYFRIPMPIQPLKSLVVTALAFNASVLEVRIATVLMGVLCLTLCYTRIDRYFSKVPKHLVHGMQAALGIILILKGYQVFAPSFFTNPSLFLTTSSVILIIFIHRVHQPVLGWLALSGLVLAAYIDPTTSAIHFLSTPKSELRIEIVGLLVLPQIFLTLTNSVIATEAVAKQYFPENSHRVSQSRLLLSIGIGNLITGSFAGLPFCHGSGGLTAHVRGGASHYVSNVIIGSFLLGAGTYAWLKHPLLFVYHPMVTSLLLIVIGWLHLTLANPTWKQPKYRLHLLSMVLVALATQNLLLSLVAGITTEVMHNAMRTYGVTK